MTAASAPTLPAAFQIAAFRRRVGARVIDGALASAIDVALTAGLNLLLVGDGFPPDDPPLSSSTSDGDLLGLLVAFAIGAAVLVAYDAWFTTSKAWNGQTPGKRLLRIRIASADGGMLAGRAAWRRATALALVLLGAPTAGVAIDLVAGTVPTFTKLGDAALWLLVLPAAAGLALRSELRQTPPDWSAATVVVLAGQRQRERSAARAADGVPLVFAQAEAAPAGVAGRANTAGTWWLAALFCVGMLCCAWASAPA